MSLPLFCVFVALLPSILNAEKCITPNNETAECVVLYSCPNLLEALVKTPNTTVEFVRQSNCGGSVINPLVCCGSLTTFASTKTNLLAPETTPTLETTPTPKTKPTPETTPTPKTAPASVTTTPRPIKGLLASRKVCGYQRTDDYFYAEHGTPVVEFPWSTLLLYEFVDNKTLAPAKCGGALINDRYVLTAGHCVSVVWLSLVAVRIGEQTLSNSTDCTNGSRYDDCSIPTQDFKVENITRHPQFSFTSFAYDIALVRLKIKVTYSDHMRPICLPTPDYQSSKVGDMLASRRWGYSNRGGLMDVKEKALKRRISNSECDSFLQLEKSGLLLTDDHFCTKALYTNISTMCGSISGGPLMFSSPRRQWQLEGILIFGGYCSDSVPEVYTKVMNYVEWISDNIFA